MTPDTWRLVSDLFSQCVNLTEDGRERLLAGVDNPTLVGEVRQLLASYKDDYMEKAAVDSIEDAWDGPSPRFHRGQRIGRYEIEEKIGRGGMSVVYRALDPHISRPVAIKFLLPDGEESGTDRKEFFREVQILGGLRQSDVVRVYDCGDFEGLPYIVMEFLEGEDLAKAIAAGRCGDFAQKLSIARQIAAAMESVHRARIVHRDLKPGNVFLGPSGQIKLMDFGIARSDGPTGNQVSRLIGTPQYVSPEQVKGKPATYLSDIYSYGVLLFELFTGKPPYGGSTAEVLYKIVHGTLPLEPLASAGLPAGLIEIIRRTSAGDPARRPQGFLPILDGLNQVSSEVRPAGARRRVVGYSAAAAILILFIASQLRHATVPIGHAESPRPSNVSSRPLPGGDIVPQVATSPKTSSTAVAPLAAAPKSLPDSNRLQPGPISRTQPAGDPVSISKPAEVAEAPVISPPQVDRREAEREPIPIATVTPAAIGPVPGSLESPEERDWNAVRNSTDVEALRVFWSTYPAGKYAREARQIAARLQYEAIQGRDDPAALRSFAQSYPDHPFAARSAAIARQLEIRAAAPGEISETLRRYADAFAAKRIDLVSTLRQLSPPQRASIVEQFSTARKIDMTLAAKTQPEFAEPADAGGGSEAPLNAVVQCQLTMLIVTHSGDFEPVNRQTPVHLKRTAKGWVITSLQ